MDAATDQRVQEVVIKKSAQTGGTAALTNIAFFYMSYDPSPILWVQTTGNEALAFSKNRFSAFLRDNEHIRKLIDPRRSTNTEKYFPGGVLLFKGALSAPGLRMMPIKVVVLDDLDGFPKSTSEGDPVGLAIARTKTFGARRKVFMCSTPTAAEQSRIHRAYLASDQRRFMVPCPACGSADWLRWEQVKWEKNRPRTTASYECPSCQVRWTEVERIRAIRKGYWQATEPFVHTAGFHINELMSPFVTLSELVANYLRACDEGEEALEVFINTSLGEVVEKKVEMPEPDRLYERREDYPMHVVPARAVVLTAGVDVQKDRLECEVVAWGAGMESWSIGYFRFEGSPRDMALWRRLEDEVLNRSWPWEEGGEMRIRQMAVDCGYETHQVYAWRRALANARVILTRGMDRNDFAIGQFRYADVNYAGRKVKNGVKYYPIGASYLKGELYSWLQLPMPDEGEPAPKYCHFPMYSREHFKQLCAEEQRVHKRHGREVIYWHQVGANEALDCRVMARAAASLLGLDHWRQSRWRATKRQKEPKHPEPTKMEAVANDEQKADTQPQQRSVARRRARRIVMPGF